MQTLSPKNGWWHCRYRIEWPEGKEPIWHADPLIAHRIIAPVLHRYNNRILLWRFHRRAVLDEEGHQFSFIIYSSQKTAQQIFKSIQSNSLLKKMKKTGLIKQDIYDDTSKIFLANIEATSDKHWAPPIRKAWPYFIMGVCQMWLSLIKIISDNLPQQRNSSSVDKLLGLYERINKDIKTLWQEQGSHSLLHHLNAVFGYEPIFIQEIRLRRF
jgi:hypothetical protein